MSDARTMPQINHVIVLMLENRSLDTMLGWLHGAQSKINLVPPDSLPNHFDGISGDEHNAADGWNYGPSHGFESLGAQRWRVPRQDPAESIVNVQRQMYGDGVGFMSDPHWGDDAPMLGFASDFQRMLPPSLGEVMGAYTPEELPVLSGLARQFGVSDRWFASVPTETDANRAFAFCGTSQGKEVDLDHPFDCTAPTIFEGLNPTGDGRFPGRSWALCPQSDITGLPYTKGADTYSERHFAGLRNALAAPNSNGRVLPYRQLLWALKQGVDVPAFCFVEPAWGAGVGDADGYIGMQGNDYHPPTWVGPAEAALAELYAHVRSSPIWEHTMLLITFDEHGGTWDHVSPPRAVRPDAFVGKSGFAFERLGPRVPTILVSPFIEQRTVFRAAKGSVASFDHTSIIKTVLAWAGTDPEFVRGMGNRVADAPMFDHVLTDEIVQPHPPLITAPDSFGEQAPLGWHPVAASERFSSLQDIKVAAAAFGHEVPKSP